MKARIYKEDGKWVFHSNNDTTRFLWDDWAQLWCLVFAIRYEYGSIRHDVRSLVSR